MACCHHDDTRLRVLSAVATGTTATESPGSVLATDSKGIHVATGQGVLCITRLQAPGGRPLAADAFLRGYALATGEQLT